MEDLQKEVMSLGQAVYGSQQAGGAPGAEGGEAAPDGGAKAGGDDVIDAEFTESDK